MNIVFLGDSVWGQKAFENLLQQGINIKAVILRYNNPDKVIQERAKNEGISVRKYHSINSEESIEDLKSFNADLAVSMSYDQIIKRPVLNIFPEGFVNCHAGQLPYYRGRNVLNWAIINGAREFGITCHFMDEGIDTGDIIHQETFEITENDNYRTVLERAQEQCPNVLVKAIDKLEKEAFKPDKQPVWGTYFIARKEGDEFIDWNWSSKGIYDFVRGICDPGPNARTWLEQKDGYYLVKIKEVNFVDEALNYNCIPGAIVGKSTYGAPLVKTGDSYLAVVEYEIEHSKRNKLKVNDRLGINWNLLFLKRLQNS